MDEELALEILSKYIGDIVTYIIEEDGYNIDIDEEYEDVLYFIYKRIERAWFKGKEPSLRELEKRLRLARRRQRIKLYNLISYLVSKYVKYKGILPLTSWRRKGFYGNL